MSSVKNLKATNNLTIDFYPFDNVHTAKCDLPPSRVVVAADVAGEAVSVHPHGGIMSLGVLSMSGKVAYSFLMHDV